MLGFRFAFAVACLTAIAASRVELARRTLQHRRAASAAIGLRESATAAAAMRSVAIAELTAAGDLLVDNTSEPP